MKSRHENRRRIALSLMRFLLFPFIIVILSKATAVRANISVVESGKSFHSKPDRSIGQQLLRDYDYMGRLQFVAENPKLCRGEQYPNQKFDIVIPIDGLPVALIALAGGCSALEKAQVAASMINQPNQVHYLIIQDYSKRHGTLLESNDIMNKDNDNDNEQKWSFFGSSQYFSSLLHDFLDYDDSYNASMNDKSFPLETTDVMESDDRNKFDDAPSANVNIAVLHVSYAAGQTLFNLVATENPKVHREGGLRLLLNGRESNVSARTVVIWMLVTFIVCACVCCCLLVFVQNGFEEEQQEAPTRPARRRLTLEQVRNRFPAFHFNPEEHHQNHSMSDAESQQQYSKLSDECTICLDEFNPGVRCRQLPCGHVFHSTCIARWLIERSAVCPLCKLDLYEEEVEDDDSDDDSEVSAPPSQVPSLLSWWSNILSRRTSTVDNAINRQTEFAVGSSVTEEANLLDENISDETRSWWPFSLESVPSTEEQEEQDNLQRPVYSRWRWTLNLFGRIRQRSTDRDMLTELTEPLVPEGERSAEEPRQQHQNTLEEMRFTGPADHLVNPDLSETEALHAVASAAIPREV